MQSCRRLLLVCCAFCVAVSAAQSSDRSKDSPEKRWEKAKQAYRDGQEMLQEFVLERLDVNEDKARNAGDAEKVRDLKRQRDAYQTDGQLPTVVNRNEYDRKQRGVVEELRKAFKSVQTAYLKDRRDSDADDVEREFNELLTPRTESPEPHPATVASRWPSPRARWKNTSYDSTLRLVKGTDWAEYSNKTGRVNIRYKAVKLTDEYFEVYCEERRQRIRFMDEKADLFKDGRWQWVANGYWEVKP